MQESVDLSIQAILLRLMVAAIHRVRAALKTLRDSPILKHPGLCLKRET